MPSEFDFIVSLGKIVGIAGICVGVFFLVFQGILGKNNLFGILTPRQSYLLLRTIIWLTFVIGVLGLGMWGLGSIWRPETTAALSGSVISKDPPYQGIAGATITAVELPQPQPRADDLSTSSGSFRLEVKNVGAQIKIKVSHPEYEELEEWVSVPQNNYVVRLSPKRLPTPPPSPDNTGCPNQQRISPDQAAACVGINKSVCGTLAQVSREPNNTIHLNFGRAFPDQTFSAVIWPEANGDAKRFQRGQNVCVIGKIGTYGPKPEIKIRNMSNVTIE